MRVLIDLVCVSSLPGHKECPLVLGPRQIGEADRHGNGSRSGLYRFRKMTWVWEGTSFSTGKKMQDAIYAFRTGKYSLQL